MPGGRILVVDDDRVLRTSIARILEEEGYTVDLASDGATALDAVESNPPDAILLDVMMPGMNGRQFLHELRNHSQSSHIPVVVMTALQGLADRAIESGANDMVEKPFDVDELLNKIALALFRAGVYDTLTDAGDRDLDDSGPTMPPRGTFPPFGRDTQRAGVVLVVEEDKRVLASIDAQLTKQGYTVVSLSRVTEELPHLARVLEPVAVVMGLHGENPPALQALKMLRADDEIRAVPVLVFAGDSSETMEGYRAQIEELSGRAIDVPIADADVAGFLS